MITVAHVVRKEGEPGPARPGAKPFLDRMQHDGKGGCQEKCLQKRPYDLQQQRKQNRQKNHQENQSLFVPHVLNAPDSEAGTCIPAHTPHNRKNVRQLCGSPFDSGIGFPSPL